MSNRQAVRRVVTDAAGRPGRSAIGARASSSTRYREEMQWPRRANDWYDRSCVKTREKRAGARTRPLDRSRIDDRDCRMGKKIPENVAQGSFHRTSTRCGESTPTITLVARIVDDLRQRPSGEVRASDSGSVGEHEWQRTWRTQLHLSALDPHCCSSISCRGCSSIWWITRTYGPDERLTPLGSSSETR